MSHMMTVITPLPGNYARTPAGYAAWIHDGHKGSYDDFINADKKRGYTMVQIQQLLDKLSDAELRNTLNFLKSKYFL